MTEHRLETVGGSDERWKFVRWLFLAFLGLWLVFTLFPLYYMIITAFKTAAETNLTIPTFWPRDWQPQNFAGVFAEPSNFVLPYVFQRHGHRSAGLLVGRVMRSAPESSHQKPVRRGDRPSAAQLLPS